MGSLLVLTVVAIAVAAFLVKLVLDRFSVTYRITRNEYIAFGVVICFLIVPGVIVGGERFARRDLVTFREFWSGWEMRAEPQTILCSRDGPCVHEYSCDPYQVPVSYSCGTSDRPRTCTRMETRYHSCPYTDTEHTYSVATTVGDFTLGSHRFPVNPDQHRWRAWHNVPDHLIESVGVGEPPLWSAARDRIAQGAPGPATRSNQYSNYVLATRHNILLQYSADIARYNRLHLLVPVPASTFDVYQANRVQFVGLRPANQATWQERARYVNAALGHDLHGTLYLVVVQNQEVNANPDSYVMALQAYWQDERVFHRDALPKNAVVVVLGTTDGSTVSFARAFTGMPVGNEYLIEAMREMIRIPLTPEAVLGNVRGQYYQARTEGQARADVRSVVDGALPRLLWGMDNSNSRFVRVSMSAGDPGDIGAGFVYLMSEVQPTTTQKIWIIAIAVLLSSILWGIAICTHWYQLEELEV